MKTAEFHEKLAESGSAPIVGSVTRYQHVERMGSSEVEGLLDSGPIVVQEKIDGANLTVAMGDDGLVICSRRQAIYAEGEIINGFRGAVDYILAHEGIKSLLEEFPDWTLRGEWLVKHTLNYPEDAWRKFYVFDIQLPDGEYVPVWEYSDHLEARGVLMVPLVAALDSPPELSALVLMSDRPSALGADKAEGIVVKRYSYVNYYGRTTWGKIVHPDFASLHSVSMGAMKHAPVEIKFVSDRISDALIDKTIAKIENDDGRHLESRDIPRVLGIVWHDAVIEEIWDFLKKNKNPTIDFRQMHKMAIDKTRGRVLAYLTNGI